MNLRSKRTVLLGLLGIAAVLFVAGIFAAWESRHATICPNGKMWIKKYDNGLLGGTTYFCPGGVTVSK